MRVAIIDSKLLAYNTLYRGLSPITLFNDIPGMLPDDITDIILVFDNGKSVYRTTLWSGYKGKRTYTTVRVDDNEYLKAIPTVAKALGCHVVMPLGVEADDLAGIITHQLKDTNVLLVTGDHDWFQLVLKYDNVMCLDVKTKQMMGPMEVYLRTGCKTEEQFLIKKCVVGDSGDNILGIPRVGDVTFKKWSDYVFNHKLDLKEEFLKLCKEKAKEGLSTHREYIMEGVHSCEELLDFNLKLGTIMCNLEKLTLEQASEIKGAYANFKANRKPTLDIAKANSLFGQYTKMFTSPFGDPMTLNVDYYKDLHDRR